MGAVVSWGAQKGFGFIKSDAVEGDVFFGRACLPPELKEVAGRGFELKGRNVVLDLNDDEGARGKLVAASVRLAVCEGETCTGLIRSFDDMSGKGWIDCASIDCGLGYSVGELPPQLQGGGLPAETVVQFVVGYAADGTFEAKQLRTVNAAASGGLAHGGLAAGGKGGVVAQGAFGIASMPSFVPSAPQAAAVGNPYVGGKGGLATGKSGAGATMATPLQDGVRLQGTVKTYNQGRGFGFLQSASVPGQDMYFKGEGLEIAQGLTLCFSLKVMPDGKLQAREVAPGLTEGGSYLASVTSYSQRNGYGFFTVPQVNQDVYFQRRAMPPEMHDFDVKGATARITVHLTGDGKPQCAAAEFLDQPPPGYVAPMAPAKAGGASSMGMAGPLAVTAVGGGGFVGGCQPQGAFGGAGCYGKVGRPAPGAPTMTPPAKRMRSEQTPDASGEVATGNILSYNPMKGWGFIKSDAVAAGDVWFGKASLPPGDGEGLQGKSVSFQLLYTPDGKPQARQIQLFD